MMSKNEMDGESKSSKDIQYPKNLYEVTSNNLDDVVHVVDKEMNVLFINKAIEALSRGELKQEDIIGKNLYDVFPFLKEKGVDKEYNEVFFMRTRDGDGCGRAAIFCNPPKNEIMGAKCS